MLLPQKTLSAAHRHALRSINGAITQLKLSPGPSPDLTILELLKDPNIDTHQASEALGIALTHACATRDVFNAYLTVHAREGNVDAVMRGMQEMTTQGIAHNAGTRIAVLEAHSWAGDTQQLLHAFHALCNSQETMDAELCTVMVVHFSRMEMRDATSATAAYDKEKGGTGLAQIKKLLEFMRAQGMPPTQSIYNALLELHMRTHDIRKLMQVWNEMAAQGVARDIQSYNMVLDGLRMSFEDGSVDKQNNAAEKKYNFKRFLEIAKELQLEPNVKPDTHTYNSLFIVNQLFPNETASPLSPILTTLEEASLASPNIFTFNSLIHQYVRERNFEKISATLAKMTHEGISLDRVTYTSLMKISATQGPEAILKIFTEMEKHQKPNSRTYQVLIAELCKVGGVDIAIKFYDKMRREGLIPHEVCYIELMDAYGGKGEIKRCKELFANAGKEGQDSVIVRDKFLSYLEKCDPAGYVLAVVEMAKKHKPHVVEKIKQKPV